LQKEYKSIEKAFLLRVLVGHWILLFALWHASLKVLKIFASMERDSEEKTIPETEIIYVPINDDPDNDWKYA
jgi:hypothetical protein